MKHLSNKKDQFSYLFMQGPIKTNEVIIMVKILRFFSTLQIKMKTIADAQCIQLLKILKFLLDLVFFDMLALTKLKLFDHLQVLQW